MKLNGKYNFQIASHEENEIHQNVESIKMEIQEKEKEKERLLVSYADVFSDEKEVKVEAEVEEGEIEENELYKPKKAKTSEEKGEKDIMKTKTEIKKEVIHSDVSQSSYLLYWY